jgi:hypothetical protein
MSWKEQKYGHESQQGLKPRLTTGEVQQQIATVLLVLPRTSYYYSTIFGSGIHFISASTSQMDCPPLQGPGKVNKP